MKLTAPPKNSASGQNSPSVRGALKNAAAFCAVVPFLFLLACPNVGLQQDSGPSPAVSIEENMDDVAVVTPRPECSADSIAESVDGTTRCATCDDDNARTICGAPVEASCVEQENSIGDPCQICLSATGEALFDSCNMEASADFIDDLDCREVRREEGDVTSSCELCTDSEGRVVSQFCRPEADLCQEEIIDGLRCNVCTQNGAFAYQECFPEPVTPASCVAYGDEQGQCTDCFNADGALILHDCEVQTAVVDASSCLDWVRPDGVRCSECYDAAGQISEQWCEDSSAEPEQCSLIVLSEFSCGVCTNVSGDITFTDCQPNVCLEALSDVTSSPDALPDAGIPDAGIPDAGIPDAPPPNTDPAATEDPCQQAVPCAVYYDAAGVVCAECTDADGLVEASCSETSTALFCSAVAQSAEPVPATGVDSCSVDLDCTTGFTCSAGVCTSTVVTQEECIVCQDRTGVEVYRNCETGSAPVAPQCFFEEGQLGLCEICLESSTGDVIYNSCADQECVFTEQRQLIDVQGDVFLPSSTTAVAELANASCEACQDGSEKCTLNALCDANAINSDTLALCEAPRVRLSYALTLCANPWSETSEPLASAAVLGWALGQNQLIFSAQVSGTQNEFSCQECSCANGLTLDVIVAQESLDFFLAAGFTSPLTGTVSP